MIFVNSMSDLFHADVPDQFIRDVFQVMQKASWHTFQVLTKRAERLQSLSQSLPWPRNLRAGVSAEYQWVSISCGALPRRCGSCRLSHCLGLSITWTLTGFSGSSWAVRRDSSTATVTGTMKEWFSMSCVPLWMRPSSFTGRIASRCHRPRRGVSAHESPGHSGELRGFLQRRCQGLPTLLRAPPRAGYASQKYTRSSLRRV